MRIARIGRAVGAAVVVLLGCGSSDTSSTAGLSDEIREAPECSAYATAYASYLEHLGVAPSEAVIRDGSGLSRYDYISPRTVVRILDAMRRSPHFKPYYDAMPIAGVGWSGTGRLRIS